MTPELIQQIVLLVTPFLVWGGTWVVSKVTGLGGIALLVVVAVIDIAVALLATFVLPEGSNIWLHLAVGLISVFVNELKKQFQQAKHKV